MLRAFTPFLFLLFFSSPLFSQLHDNVWIIGRTGTPGFADWDHSLLDFSTSPISLYDKGKIPTFINRCGKAFSDTNGQLLFYSNGYQIYNTNDTLMENGDSMSIDFRPGPPLSFGSPMYQGNIILQYPSVENKYSIIHLNAVGYGSPSYRSTDLLYSEINMSANNELGAVVKKNISIIQDSLQGNGITTVQHSNGRDWWILVFRWESGEYYKVLFSPKGTEVIGKDTVDVVMKRYIYGSKFTPDGSKFAFHTHDWGWLDTPGKPWVHIFEFDRCTGTLGNRTTIQYSESTYGNNQGRSISFSPNSRFLYIFRDFEVFQVDLQASDPQSSLLKIADQDGFVSHYPTSFASSQLAPDGRIYINDYAPLNDYFHILEQPNEKGALSKMNQHALQLEGMHGWSLPNHPNYRLGPLEGSPCDTLGLEKDIFLAAHPYPFEACTGGEAHFEVTAFGTGRQYQWQMSTDGGSTWTDVQAGTHFTGENTDYLLLHTVPATFNQHQFRCIVTGNTSTETSRPAALTLIGAAPSAQITYEQDRDSVFFSDASTNSQYVKWYWPDGDSTINDATPDYLFLSEGLHSVILVATNACGTDTAWADIEIAPLEAHLTASPTFGCAPLTVTYDSRGSSHRSKWRDYLFLGGDPPTAMDINTVEVTYHQPGVYDAQLWVTVPLLEADTVILEDYITVLEGTNPTAEIEIQQNGSTVELNAPFDLADSYIWSLSNGDTLAGQMTEYDFDVPGLYQIQLATTNHCGTATGSIKVIVGQPSATFTVSQQQGCAPFYVQFENTTDFGGAAYEWHFPSGQPAHSSEHSPSVFYETPGLYDVQLIVHADTLTDTLETTAFIEVISDPCPQPTLSIQSDGLETTIWSDCMDAMSFSWDMGDGASYSTPSVIHQYAESGTYEITLIIEDACGIDTLKTTESIIGTAANDLKRTNYISLVPNPTAGQVQVISENGFPTGASLSVFDALGRIVFQVERPRWKPQEPISLNELANGVYLFRFESNNGKIQIGKLVKN